MPKGKTNRTALSHLGDVDVVKQAWEAGTEITDRKKDGERTEYEEKRQIREERENAA